MTVPVPPATTDANMLWYLLGLSDDAIWYLIPAYTVPKMASRMAVVPVALKNVLMPPRRNKSFAVCSALTSLPQFPYLTTHKLFNTTPLVTPAKLPANTVLYIDFEPSFPGISSLNGFI